MAFQLLVRLARCLSPAGEVGAVGLGMGCSAPEIRSRTGSSTAYWSRAATGSPADPVHVARLARAVRVWGVLSTGDSLADGQGTVYTHQDGDSTTRYYKSTGTGNTGWSPLAVP